MIIIKITIRLRRVSLSLSLVIGEVACRINAEFTQTHSL